MAEVPESRLSKSQINRLGERLRKGPPSEEDLRLLDEYRRSFAQAYEAVVSEIRVTLQLQPTGRPEKSTPSIADKLAREKTRLSQMQDIAGCRLVVDDISAQERVLEQLRTIFPQAKIVDRRKQASHGYRAVHLIVEHGSRPVEIQLRTTLEHRWAELSEKLADVWGTEIKYGGGRLQIRQALDEMSQSVERVEKREFALHEVNQAMSKQRSKAELGVMTPEELEWWERKAKTTAAELAKAREELFTVFDRTLAIFTKSH